MFWKNFFLRLPTTWPSLVMHFSVLFEIWVKIYFIFTLRYSIYHPVILNALVQSGLWIIPKINYISLNMHDPMLFMHTPVMLFMLFMIPCYSCVHTSLHTPIHTPIHNPIIIAISIAHFNLKNVEMKEKNDKNLNIKKN